MSSNQKRYLQFHIEQIDFTLNRDKILHPLYFRMKYQQFSSRYLIYSDSHYSSPPNNHINQEHKHNHDSFLISMNNIFKWGPILHPHTDTINFEIFYQMVNQKKNILAQQSLDLKLNTQAQMILDLKSLNSILPSSAVHFKIQYTDHKAKLFSYPLSRYGHETHLSEKFDTSWNHTKEGPESFPSFVQQDVSPPKEKSSYQQKDEFKSPSTQQNGNPHMPIDPHKIVQPSHHNQGKSSNFTEQLNTESEITNLSNQTNPINNSMSKAHQTKRSAFIPQILPAASQTEEKPSEKKHKADKSSPGNKKHDLIKKNQGTNDKSEDVSTLSKPLNKTKPFEETNNEFYNEKSDNSKYDETIYEYEHLPTFLLTKEQSNTHYCPPCFIQVDLSGFNK
ncbi:hypothetical protein TRFO_20138 [Tritrichomonas foetus]|uniref:Uncharacterized protein n=1 Tax=Tritrichomonas foetus TaxID=1144522 RepID=A0A1J4KHM9_9EUKA|nr:hypothetical protein TRFO_20138 [Tritrichomonas foetus]|eukprot:OHT10546.1 hypothetical protein TRFO_20138 [Tritrichomonas foetus]